MFTEMAKELGAQSWANSLGPSALSAKHISAWKVLLCAELMMRNAEYEVSGTENGDLEVQDTSTSRTVAVFSQRGVGINEYPDSFCDWAAIAAQGIHGTLNVWSLKLPLSRFFDLDAASVSARTLRAIASVLVDSVSSRGDLIAGPLESIAGGLTPYSEFVQSLEVNFPASRGEAKPLLWAIMIDGALSRIINLRTATAHRVDGAVLPFQWP